MTDEENETISKHLIAINKHLTAINNLLTAKKQQTLVQSVQPTLPPIDISNPKWPVSIPKYMIVTTETEKIFRASQLVTIDNLDFYGKNVLDFGCGEGHISTEIGHIAKTVLGFDIKSNQYWSENKQDNVSYSISDHILQAKAPYDVIYMHDVIDHLEGISLPELFNKLKPLMSPRGQIFIRAHPWTARHGAHLYQEGYNQAFLHLVLTDTELNKLLQDKSHIHTNKIYKPMNTYETAINASNLKIISKAPHTDNVEPFFNGVTMDRILHNFRMSQKSINEDQVLKIMSVNYIDYIISNV